MTKKIHNANYRNMKLYWFTQHFESKSVTGLVISFSPELLYKNPLFRENL